VLSSFRVFVMKKSFAIKFKEITIKNLKTKFFVWAGNNINESTG